jgi:hypothetical protein
MLKATVPMLIPLAAYFGAVLVAVCEHRRNQPQQSKPAA